MKKLTLTLVVLLLSIHVFSQDFSTKQGGHCYTLEIPGYMTKSFVLNDVATLQYQNTTKEAYVIVIEDAKDHMESVGMKFVDSEDFLDYFMSDYKIEAENRKVSDIREFESNENEHAQVELTWYEDDTDLYMLITTVETDTHFYKIMCWTTGTNIDLLKNDFWKISKSLKD
jgi:hypothetical protein